MIFPKNKKKSRRIGNPESRQRGVRCLNRLCVDAFIAGRKNIRKGSAYGPERRVRWLCSSCGKTFSETKFQGSTFRLRKPDEASMARRLRLNGLTLRHISLVVGASRSTIARWLKN